jgi:recombination protein RecA
MRRGHKCAPPFKEAEFDIRWGLGIDGAADLIDYAVALGVVEKSGAHLSFGGEHLGQGRERARDAVLAKAPLAGALRSAVEAALKARGIGSRGPVAGQA